MSKQKTVTKKPAPGAKGKVVVRGKVTHKINGRVVRVEEKEFRDKPNAISNDLFAYFRDSMDSAVDKAINSLFNTDEVGPGGAQDGNDGIALYDATAEQWLTFETVTEAATETYGKRWVGTLTTSQAREVTQVALGHSYEAGTPPFDTVYATQGFSGISLASGATYEVDWEIYLGAAA